MVWAADMGYIRREKDRLRDDGNNSLDRGQCLLNAIQCFFYSRILAEPPCSRVRCIGRRLGARGSPLWLV